MAQSGSTVLGGDVVAKNIIAFGEKFLREVNKDMYRVRDLLSGQIRKNISLTDHSLQDLKELDHPYASRHGSEGARIHEPYWQVHTQSGEMLSGLVDGVEDADIAFGGKLTAEAWAGIADFVEHAKNVVFGTSRMIPRDFLNGSLQEIKGQIMETLSRSLKNTVVSFNGEKVKL